MPSKKHRNNKKKKALPKSLAPVGGAAVAVAVTTATATKTVLASAVATYDRNCGHGSTVEKLKSNDNDYSKTLHNYIAFCKDLYAPNKYNEKMKGVLIHFWQLEHNFIFTDPKFYQYVFANCLEDYVYLKAIGKYSSAGYENVREIIELLVKWAISLKHGYFKSQNGEEVLMGSVLGEKVSKYTLDITTERGLIKCLARETAPFCNCMVAAKTEAMKNMEKLGRCSNCQEYFPRETLLKCTGCGFAQYHSKECQVKHWPSHKDECKFCPIKKK
mmetsp:Transcript_4672/g.5007  ORF Transcript_4672/g.5007 Transcript_4672/m.5007 type:complete len:273 (-) Transcript_4672:149-967(-)